MHGLALCFAAGSFGGLVNSLALWAAGAHGVTGALGVSYSPGLSPAWLYPRIVWGGMWGALFLLPFPRLSWWLRALVFSLGPTAVMLVLAYEGRSPIGLHGLGPVLIAAANAGVSGISCLGHDDGNGGDIAWHDANSLLSRTRWSISCWPARMRRPRSTRTASWTN